MSGIMNKKGQPNLPRIAGIAIAILITLLLIGIIIDGGEGVENGNGGTVECEEYDMICQAQQAINEGAVFLGSMVGLG
tara:strand:- start:751 stop:984 length:234 start_codon:yes stop_codon:yes gene_type:complete